MQFMVLAPMMRELSSGNSIYEDSSVIVVGDEKQSIYGWRGGEKGLLNYMKTFLNTSIESLKTCYRSVPVLVDFVNELLGEKRYQGLLDDWSYKGDVSSAKIGESGAVWNYFYEEDKDSDTTPHFEFINNMVMPTIKDNLHLMGETVILARENKDLEEIASLLRESGFSCILESSNSIFEHIIPKTILWLMRYIQYKDYNALLRFLRSDVVLMDTAELKKIAMCISSQASLHQRKLEEGNTLLLIKEIFDSYHSDKDIDFLHKNPMTLCHEIVNKFQYTSIFQNEADIKNLHMFMNIISEFMNAPKEYSADLDGFIRYAEDSKDKNDKRQLSTEEKDAIQLMTIHKSKGLEFDTVFLYINSTKNSSARSVIDIDFIINNQSYNKLSDVFITMNYKAVLKDLFADEHSLIEHKKEVEEMNTLYVAMTRAKANMGIFWVYKEKNLIENKNLKCLVAKHAKELSESNPEKYMNSKFVKITHHCEASKEKYIHPKQDCYKEYFDISNSHLRLKEVHDAKLEGAINLKNLFINKKSRLIGSATHVYLSFIKYDLPYEHDIAYKQTIRLYGNIMTKERIMDVANNAKNFIEQHQYIFDRKWDKVFNEFSVIDKEKRLYRIDRLMINTREKEIMIIDYKTGQSSDENQIENYMILIKNMPAMMQDNYKIQGKYVAVIDVGMSYHFLKNIK